MLLTKYSGNHFKCIEDSGEISVHHEVTRLVGQNEAGKTALLEILNILKPISGSLKFELEDYPRGKLSQYKKQHTDKPHVPVRATFQLNENEIADVEKKFGTGVLTSPTLELSKEYEQKGLYRLLHVNEQAYLKHFIASQKLDDDLKGILKKSKSINELKAEAANLSEQHQVILKTLSTDLHKDIYSSLNVPYFFYFDEYAALPGEISLKKLKQFVDDENYSGADAESLRTAKALIDIAGADVDEFLNKDNYERLKADLEAASNEISDQLKTYWTTNQNLEIRFDLQPVLNSANVLTDTTLHIRVYNSKHRVTVPFEKRSKGFVWFFSFLVAFSEYKDRDEKIILLLDEPGTNLGAVAQRDLMKYFEAELTPHHQIIYTTHSPFMIDARQLDTVRTVEDEAKTGTRVSNDPCRHTSETLFPLQAALGYDLSQTLFVAPNNLLVEGPADLIYFNLATQVLANESRIGLSDEWTVVPVGGADKVASFVSLLGAQGLNLAVFMDASKNDQQKFQSILANKLMLKKNLMTVGSILGRQEADIEDLFSPESYIKLVNKSYASVLGEEKIAQSDLTTSSPRIVKKLEDLFEANGLNNGKFNHYKPAYDLMCNPEWLAEIFDVDTKNNFEKSFTALNQVLHGEVNEAAVAALPVSRFKKVSQKKNSNHLNS